MEDKALVDDFFKKLINSNERKIIDGKVMLSIEAIFSIFKEIKENNNDK